jgi:D-glycerate 3-kinase
MPQWQSALLERHQLDTGYLAVALKWFAPLAQALMEHQKSANRPVLVALNGCQGSGKTTISDYLCTSLTEEYGLSAVALSLDDFYFTWDERQALATSVHPLLATRGVPGTHDMALLRQTLQQLLDAHRAEPVTIPRFDKAADDRRPTLNGERHTNPVQLVLLEGWCLGAEPQTADMLSQPINTLEQDEDPTGQWRRYSNATLSRDFRSLYSLVDQWIMLRAPSFDCVYDWRREQERKLAATLPPGRASKLMNDNALRRFIQHYERITRRCLDTLPPRVHHLFSLDEQRQVTAYRHRRSADTSQ